ncbi:MFS transporter [Acaryochloris sp. IP29b_bin.148]|uniref:MFS transporter n=1 Tax=Acaryochloris sp. IP29b_bin.148 TaxID=2969218 RepID=UPI002607B67C|nr:MFS transporter [Acaryochloris sp. IP29b_bin.148]
MARTLSKGLLAYGTIWAGQCASLIGSDMTNFAVTLWAWEQTGQATPISLLVFFTLTPKVAVSLFAGIWVDRYNRKQLMLLGNGVAGLSTIVILILLQTHRLSLWHLFISCGVNSLFSYIQNLSFSASTTTLISKQHYGRAGAMNALKSSGAYVFAPAFAGALYPWTGLIGVLGIDLLTFGLAMISLWLIDIPQPVQKEQPQAWQQQIMFGFRYISQQPGLRAILIFLCSSNLFTSASVAIMPAVILLRSGNDVRLLAMVQSALGLGGILGAMVLSISGGLTPRIYGLLLGIALPQLGWITISMVEGKWVWVVLAFASACFMPLAGASNQAIWLAKVDPNLQGRVFATRYLLAQASTPIGAAIAGPLSDHLFEPALQSQGILSTSIGSWLGTGPGMGTALQLSLFALCNLLIGLSGYGFRQLREVENLIPDFDQNSPIRSWAIKE